MVRTCLLNSDKGISIVLLNWSDAPINNLTITINNSNIPNFPVIAPHSSISSAQHTANRIGPVTVTPSSTTPSEPLPVITLSLLEYVDVITIGPETIPHANR